MFIDEAPSDEASKGGSSEIEQLRTLLYTDDLTGLYNRRFFRHCCAEQKAQADNGGSSFALLMIDIDHFKRVNDTCGHAAGDQALIQIAGILQDELKDTGWAFRYAGDEFVAIVRRATEQQIEHLCSNILLRTPHLAQNSTDSSSVEPLSLSIGYALYPSNTNNLSRLMELADRALYSAKRNGRNCYRSAKEVLEKETETSPPWPVQVQCPSLVGRHQQWTALQHHYSECKEGRGRVLFVTGQAGIGKSRFVTSFFRRQRAADNHLLFGECTESTVIHPYAPIRDALRKGFEAKDPATVNVYKQLDDQFRRQIVTLVPQFQRFEKQSLQPNESTDRYLLLESVLLLLQGLSKQLPTVVVLEDLHWSDEATLHFLQYMARHVGKQRLLVVATFRDEEAVHTILPTVVQNMSRENLFESIALGALSPDESASMLQRIFHGYHVPDTLTQWIHAESEGIPFYIEELLKVLMDDGHIIRSEKQIEFQTPAKSLLPYTIRALLQRRTNKLDERLKRVIGHASVIGYEFDLNLLSRLNEENEGYLLDLLEELTRLQLIRETSAGHDERFSFTHSKVRDVVYEDLGLIKRKKLHHRIAEILRELHAEDLPLYVEDLAYHYANGGDSLRASEFFFLSGKKALQIHSYADALTCFNRCSVLAESEPEVTASWTAEQLSELYTKRAIVLEVLGRTEEAAACFQKFTAWSNENEVAPKFRAEALINLGRLYYGSNDLCKAADVARQALDLSQKIAFPAGICYSSHIIAKIQWRQSRPSEALETLRAAILEAEKHSLETERARLLNTMGIVLIDVYNYSQALEAFQKAHALLTGVDRSWAIECLVNIGMVRHLQGSLDEARHHIIQASAMAEEAGDPFRLAGCCVNQAEVEWKLSNYETSRRLNERASRLYTDLNYERGHTHCLENQAQMLMVRGRLEEALEKVRSAEAIAWSRSTARRVAELNKLESSILYYSGSFVSCLSVLDSAQKLAQGIHDPVAAGEVLLKKGFVYFTLHDVAEALNCWRDSLKDIATAPPAELVFWRCAAAAFIAAYETNESEMFAAQREMRVLSEKMRNAYLITASSLLCALHFQSLDRVHSALKAAEEAEKSALHFVQDLWISRSRVKLYELRLKVGETVSFEQVRNLLDTTARQHQMDLVNRCYKLLHTLQPQNDAIKDEWTRHWSLLKNEVPTRYQLHFQPAI